MCAVSVITDYGMRTGVLNSQVQKIKDFYKLYLEAKTYDDVHGEPDCESEDKKLWLKEIRSLIEEG